MILRYRSEESLFERQFEGKEPAIDGDRNLVCSRNGKDAEVAEAK